MSTFEGRSWAEGIDLRLSPVVVWQVDRADEGGVVADLAAVAAHLRQG